MNAVTKLYVYPSVTVTYTVFGSEKQVGAVYSVTEMDNGYTYINSAEYPFHYELTDTEITVNDTGTAYITYVSEVV